MEPSTPKTAFYIIFSALALALLAGYLYSPTFRGGVVSLFESSSTKQAQSQPAPEPEVPETFTATTFDLPKNGTKSVAYSFNYYPKHLIAQQMSNGVVAVGTPDSSQVMLIRTFYRPKTTSLTAAWEEIYKSAYYTTSVPIEIKSFEVPLAFPHGSTWAAYSDGIRQWVVAQFPERLGWFFMFDITTATNQDLIPSIETFSVIE